MSDREEPQFGRNGRAFGEAGILRPRRLGRPPKPPIPYPGSSFGLGKGQVVEIPLEEIDLDDTTFELRVTLKPELLVDSVRNHGIQMPVVLRKHPRRKEKYQIVCGFRRTTAAKMAGLKSVPAMVRDLSDEEAHVLAFAENEYRRTLNDLDRANGIAKLRQNGKREDEVAKLYRLSDRQVRRLQELLEYPGVIKRALDDGDSGLTTTHATILMQASRKYGSRFDVGSWVGQLRRKARSVEQLRADIREQMEGGQRRRRMLVRRTGDRVTFNLATIKAATDAGRRDAVERLRELIKEINA
ncbi:MAG: ParB/RepB/Spo0J family partition protein [Deltaproteobacteria bacterium]|nr:ParB/RepB/Spo0J family partition protein [Deltaproteobacteria bacterium]